MAYNTASWAAQCKSNPFSGGSLRKTGLFNEWPETFAVFGPLPRNWEPGDRLPNCKSPPLAGFLHKLRSTQDNAHRLAGDAVLIAPVST